MQNKCQSDVHFCCPGSSSSIDYTWDSKTELLTGPCLSSHYRNYAQSTGPCPGLGEICRFEL